MKALFNKLQRQKRLKFLTQFGIWVDNKKYRASELCQRMTTEQLFGVSPDFRMFSVGNDSKYGGADVNTDKTYVN